MADNDGADGAGADAAPTAEVTEGRARRMGWRPKEEFRGDPSRWTDAQTFIERGEAELPILRDRYRALDDRFVAQGGELKEMKERVTEMGNAFKEFRNLHLNAEERAYQRAKREVEARMAQAAAIADQPAYTAAKADLDDLEKTKPVIPKDEPKQVTAPVNPSVPPEIPAWIAENPWYNTDPEMNSVAGALHQQIQRQKPQLTMTESLAEVKQRIMSLYPDRFDNRRRSEPGAVSAPTGGSTTPAKKKTTFADLPADAKAAYESFKRAMPEYKQEDYLKTYLSQFAEGE